MSNILVTGATSFIGNALVHKLAMSNQGTLLLHGRNLQNLNLLQNKYQDKKIYTWVHDLASLEGLHSSLTEVLDRCNEGIDTFVHCAGISSPLPIKGFTEKFALRQFNVNFFSALQIVSILLQKKENSTQLKNIIFVTSIWGKFGSVGYSLYGGSKSALTGAMRSLSVELAPHTRVNSVALGAIETPMSSESFHNSDILQFMQKTYPLGMGKPVDAANILSFLISEESRWITGQEFVVDGGRTSNMSNRNVITNE
jgi:NAD(P)-dependent dehydrogenase (short-subunit alcohol dehydrogenase family)